MRTPRRRWLPASLVSLAVVLTGCQTSGPIWHGGSPPASAPATSMPPPSPSPTANPTATPPEIAEADCVNGIVAAMSLDEIAGQVMLVGTPVDDPTSVVKMLKAYHFGGIFLAGRSKASAGTLRAGIKSLQANAPRGTKLIISLDQEGGDVQTLQGSDFPPIPTAVVQGTETQDELGANTVKWAQKLAAIGVNLDLAPVADTVPASLGTDNPPIGYYHREYGSDPVKVAAAIAIVVPAIQSTGVLTTLKHFPGLGRVRANTDTSKDAVDNVATVDDPYLGPFRAGIRTGAGAVMISSASYPKLDSTSIAAFSRPIITDLLRKRLGFHGLIVSDALGGAAAISNVPAADRAVRFIRAGGNMALTVQASTAPAMINGLIAEAKASAEFAAQLHSAAAYVLRTKYGAGLLSCSPHPTLP